LLTTGTITVPPEQAGLIKITLHQPPLAAPAVVAGIAGSSTSITLTWIPRVQAIRIGYFNSPAFRA